MLLFLPPSPPSSSRHGRIICLRPCACVRARALASVKAHWEINKAVRALREREMERERRRPRMNAQAFPHKAASVEQHPGILHCCTLNVRRKLNSRARRAKNRPRALCDPRPASSTQTPVEENQATACPPLLSSPRLSNLSLVFFFLSVDGARECV